MPRAWPTPGRVRSRPGHARPCPPTGHRETEWFQGQLGLGALGQGEVTATGGKSERERACCLHMGVQEETCII